MRNPRHIALALAIVVIWGVNFVAIGHALEGFPPILLAALRFALTGLAAIVRPAPEGGPLVLGRRYQRLHVLRPVRPAVHRHGARDARRPGLPGPAVPGALHRPGRRACCCGERTGLRQLLGIAAAVAGLVVIGAGRGGNVPLSSLLLAIAAGRVLGAGLDLQPQGRRRQRLRADGLGEPVRRSPAAPHLAADRGPAPDRPRLRAPARRSGPGPALRRRCCRPSSAWAPGSC